MTAWKPMNQTSFAFAHDRSGRGRRSRMDNTGNRLFFGLCPPPAIERQVASIADDYKNAFSLSGQLRLTTLHVTIRWVCDYPNLPEHVIFAALQAGVGAESPPITITFDRIMRFPQALVLAGEGGRKSLARLHLQLGVAMHNAGLPRNIGHTFTPHMTLLYDRKAVPVMMLDRPVSWTAYELLLIHSVLGKTEHHIVDRWPLLG